jgi:hypothetical protein
VAGLSIKDEVANKLLSFNRKNK